MRCGHLGCQVAAARGRPVKWCWLSRGSSRCGLLCLRVLLLALLYSSELWVLLQTCGRHLGCCVRAYGLEVLGVVE